MQTEIYQTDYTVMSGFCDRQTDQTLPAQTRWACLIGYLKKIKIQLLYTRVIFYVRREVDLMTTAKVNAYIMHIFGKIELLSIHTT